MGLSEEAIVIENQTVSGVWPPEDDRRRMAVISHAGMNPRVFAWFASVLIRGNAVSGISGIFFIVTG